MSKNNFFSLKYRYKVEEKVLKYILDKQSEDISNLKDRVYHNIQKNLNLGDGSIKNSETSFFVSIMNCFETNGYIKRLDFAYDNCHVAQITPNGQEFLRNVVKESNKENIKYIFSIIPILISIISVLVNIYLTIFLNNDKIDNQTKRIEDLEKQLK